MKNAVFFMETVLSPKCLFEIVLHGTKPQKTSIINKSDTCV
jgi:hypothetical protein